MYNLLNTYVVSEVISSFLSMAADLAAVMQARECECFAALTVRSPIWRKL